MKRAIPLLATLLLAGCSAVAPTESAELAAEVLPEGPSARGAVETCSLPESALLDDGTGLMLDGEGDEDTVGTLSVEEIGCALVALETPQSTIAKMSNTRALDGMQSDQDEHFEYTWTYHPDAGLDVIVTSLDE